MTVVQVIRLSIVPVKGMAVHHPPSIDLRPYGAVGDRAFFLVNEDDTLISLTQTGAFASLRAELGDGLTLFEGGEPLRSGPVEVGEPVLANFYGAKLVPGRVVRGPWAGLLSARAGRPVRLVRADAPGGGVDVAPVTLLGTGSLRRLAEQVGEPVDPRRFRMLIELGTDEPHLEDTWRDAHLHGGEVILRVGGGVPRCAAVTRHPDQGDRDLPLVRAIKQYRGLQQLDDGPGVPFGVYADVVRAGRLGVGETLRLVRGDTAETVSP